jgi:hypothetical protein
MNWSFYGTVAAVYLLLMSSVLLIMLSSLGVYYFSRDIILFSPEVRYTIVFGSGIGVSVLVFIGLWVFLMVPRWKCNYVVTFPAFFILMIVYIAIAVHGSTERYLSNWGTEWSNDVLGVETLQITHNCCGWENASDRAIEPCPDSFQSGCILLVSSYLRDRFAELFTGASVTFAVGLTSSILLFVVAYRAPETSVLSHVQES